MTRSSLLHPANWLSRSSGPALVLLLVGSGCAALMYEVIWFQLLQLVIGSSSVSLGILLGTFMGGMCLGSLLVPRLVDRQHHPLRVYAALEAAIAACGVFLVWAMPVINGGYMAFGGGHLPARIAIACACLLPPTMAMGATLPAVARWVETSPAGVSWLGFFYAGNLLGAVAGTVLTGFYLLRVFDVHVASYSAATINLAVALSALMIARRWPALTAVVPAVAERVATPIGGIHVVVALSGLTAVSAEVLWTRILALAFGATVYTFSLILAAFLIGLGGGSGLGALFVRRSAVRPHVALGWCQILVCCAIAFGAYLLAQVLPFWSMAEASSNSPLRTFESDLLRALIVVLPGALLWGASMPFAVAAVAAPGQDAGRLVGGVYAANTAGAIAGALGTSLLLAGSVGSQHTQQLLVGVAGIAGMLALSWSPDTSTGIRPTLWIGVAAAIVVLVPTVSPVPGALIAYGRRSAEWAETVKVADAGQIIYAGEGVNDFVAVSRGPAGERYYHAAGKIQASTQPPDMRLQLLLAHLSHLVPARSSNVLVIGCGAGITAGALGLGPGVERITIADIEPLVPQVAAAYFGDVNHHIISDPRVSLRIDDGRHVLATTTETFDVITTDLIDPWVKGVAALFTREFFELAKRHLRPGGVVTQFVQLYQSSPEAVKSEIATFVDAFPDAIVWGNPHEGQGYDLVLLGQIEPTRIDVDELDARLARPEFAPVRESLGTIGIDSASALLATYAAAGADLRSWLQGAAVNRDRNLRLQYLAGLGLDRDENGPIYQEIVGRSTVPLATFVGAPATLQALRRAIDERRPK